MDSIASFTIETGGQKDHVMQSTSSMVMQCPLVAIVKRCYGIHLYWMQNKALIEHDLKSLYQSLAQGGVLGLTATVSVSRLLQFIMLLHECGCS